MSKLNFFITGHKGFETLLFHELRDLLATADARLKKAYGGVEIEAGIEAAYRICLHSRCANRVFLELSRFKAVSEGELYAGVSGIDWADHLRVDNSLAVSATLSRSLLGHAHYAALRVKDAIVDQFTADGGRRPNVARQRPDVQLHLHVHCNRAQLSIDLSGESLHRRGYRLEHAGAPLKEHLAAALLRHAGWTRASAVRQRLVDPMCGSGTFAIEAALIAANIPPGLTRDYHGFTRWRGHDAGLWQECIARARNEIRRPETVQIHASDSDPAALDIARANAERAQVAELIEFDRRPVAELELPACEAETLVIANPPWGKRLQSEQDLAELYADLGALVTRFAPARLALLSANPALLHRLKLTQVDRKPVKNGKQDCIFSTYARDAKPVSATSKADPVADIGMPLRNRLLKNRKHLQRWARKNAIHCYRLYDADLPEFAFTLDRFESEIDPEVEWLHLQEYQAPASIDGDLAAQRIETAREVVKSLFAIPEERLFCKTRSRQRGSQQYQKQDDRREFFQIREGAASLLVNLSDYLDTGLFLDHRLTRERIYRQAEGKSVLNLFCYTGAVGVQAGLGGARSVLNVDLSATYLDWAAENHALNRLDDSDRYGFLRADVLDLLESPERFSLDRDYDLIFLDPPSFSNSDRMRQTLDLQRDHAGLIVAAMGLLATQGLLLFSCNRRGFRLAPDMEQRFSVTDITRATIPEDFRRSPAIHRCWEIRHRA